MSQFKLFEFSDEIVERIRSQRSIPVNFYNKDGQILIGKMDDASSERIEKLFHFMHQGIYFNEDDREKLGIEEVKPPDPTLEGLTNTRLLGTDNVDEIAGRTDELFQKLKSSSLDSAYTRTSQKMMNNIFTDFNNQEDAMVGIINVLELMQNRDAGFDVTKAVKRIVTSMALKTRGMKIFQNNAPDSEVKSKTTDLMMSALLCDIGYFKMQLPESTKLTSKQMKYIHNHPMLSYLMVVHDQVMTPHVKHSILNHHRPHHAEQNVNNYPSNDTLISKLLTMREKFRPDLSKRLIVEDIEKQIEMFKHEELYNEDANILAISSEFASLTSDTAWRKAFRPARAVKMIINNSYFTYPMRIVREFLDYVSISLCDNEKIITEGDFVVVSSQTSKGDAVFELCRVEEVGRYQSRPAVRRYATLAPSITAEPKLRIAGFNFETMRKDPRKAHYDLRNDDSKRIIYTIDRETDEALYDYILSN